MKKITLALVALLVLNFAVTSRARDFAFEYDTAAVNPHALGVGGKAAVGTACDLLAIQQWECVSHTQRIDGRYEVLLRAPRGNPRPSLLVPSGLFDVDGGVAAPALASSCATPDPFVSLGGGTCISGNWFPPSNSK